MIFGTPHYMSPEQGHAEPLDERSDLYSLGIILFEMLTREKPYRAENPMAIVYKHRKEPVPRLPQPVRRGAADARAPARQVAGGPLRERAEAAAALEATLDALASRDAASRVNAVASADADIDPAGAARRRAWVEAAVRALAGAARSTMPTARRRPPPPRSR